MDQITALQRVKQHRDQMIYEAADISSLIATDFDVKTNDALAALEVLQIQRRAIKDIITTLHPGTKGYEVKDLPRETQEHLKRLDHNIKIISAIHGDQLEVLAR